MCVYTHTHIHTHTQREREREREREAQEKVRSVTHDLARVYTQEHSMGRGF